MKDDRRELMRSDINNSMDALFSTRRGDYPDADLKEMFSEIIQSASEWYLIIDKE